MQENIGGLVALAIGLLLLVIGAWGVAGLKENQWNPFLTIIIVLIGQVIALPVTIGMLMVIGGLLGIEYGSFTTGTINLAGMGCLVSGLSWVADWVGIPDFIAGPVLCILSIGLFMALMRLDVWETIATMVGLNVISYLINIVFFVLLAILLASAANKVGGGKTGGGSGGAGSQFIEDAEFDDDEPRPAKMPPQGKGAKRPKQPVPDVDD